MEKLASLDFRPTPYGLTHLYWVLITVAVCVVVCFVLARRHSQKCDDVFLFVCGILLIASEVFKQIFMTAMSGHYVWTFFPFQFCSMPMYFTPFVLFIKNKKVKDIFYSFIAFYGLIAGIAVLAVPSGIFDSIYGIITLHSCFWHSTMVIMGVYLVVAKDLGRKITEPLRGLFIFVPVVGAAVLFNEIMYEKLFCHTGGNFCAALFISRHYRSVLPVLGDIWAAVPYPVFVLIYIAAFAAGTVVIWAILAGIRKLCKGTSRR